MRALAAYVMRGRREAVLVSVIASGTLMFFWAGAAVIALVTLRKGVREGLHLLFWASLPAVVMMFVGHQVVPFTALLGTSVAAIILRSTVSWPWAMVATTLLALLCSLAVLWLARPLLDELVAQAAVMVAQINTQLEIAGSQSLPAPTALQLAGAQGVMQSFASIGSLLLARWWQAGLFNPGGFKIEFHRLRLHPVAALVLLSASVACALMKNGWMDWAWIFAAPLFFSGLGLVHGLVSLRGMGGQWLVLIYSALIFLPPIRELLAMLAVVDSWLDFRARVAKSIAPRPGSGES